MNGNHPPNPGNGNGHHNGNGNHHGHNHPNAVPIDTSAWILLFAGILYAWYFFNRKRQVTK